MGGNGRWTIVTAIAGFLLLIIGAWIGIPNDSQGLNEPQGEYTWPIVSCAKYLDNKTQGVHDADTENTCATHCVGVINWSAERADRYWQTRVTNQREGTIAALLAGTLLAVGAVVLSRRRPPIWNGVFYVALALTVAELSAFVGVAVHERWIQPGPRALREATVPILKMSWNDNLWVNSQAIGPCAELLSALDTRREPGLATLKYTGLGERFPNLDRGTLLANQEVATKDDIDRRSTDARRTIDSVRHKSGLGVSDYNHPPHTEPDLYQAVPNLAKGAQARSGHLFAPLTSPFANWPAWRFGLFVQMAALSLACTLLAMGGVLAWDRITEWLQNQKEQD